MVRESEGFLTFIAYCRAYLIYSHVYIKGAGEVSWGESLPRDVLTSRGKVFEWRVRLYSIKI